MKNSFVVPHLTAKPLSAINTMKIEIDKEEFIKSNILNLNSDVESVFSIDSNFGLKGQLLKLPKSENLKTVENLSILLGRLACIGEEWNYKTFKEKEWENIYNPKREKTENILKVFEKSNLELFKSEFNNFKKYFTNKEFEKAPTSIKITPNFRTEYKFDGLNINEYYKEDNFIESPSLLKFDIFNEVDIKLIIRNNKHWYWNLWYIETNNENYLFERIIIS